MWGGVVCLLMLGNVQRGQEVVRITETCLRNGMRGGQSHSRRAMDRGDS